MKRSVLILTGFILMSNMCFGVTRYVSLSGAHTAPYDSWANAATNIQDAVDAAAAGETVLVADGDYIVTSQIVIADAITLQSQNALGATIDAQNKANVRCVRVTASGATIDGFRIQGGYLVSSSSADFRGANIYCSDDSVTVQNCVISGGKIRVTSHARAYGAGAFNGTYINCDFLDNHALYYGSSWGATLTRGGAAYSCILEDCYVAGNTSKRASGAIGNPSTLAGGGLYACEATGCILENNVARQSGGGAQSSTLRNCLITGNQAERATGAGTHASTLESCTVADNIGQGINGGAATNCIIFGNTVTNWAGTVSVSYSCTVPNPGGTGNITQFSGFRNGYFPNLDAEVVNAGVNETWMTGDTDLRGAPRILDGTVDMGCYEQGPLHYVSPDGSAASPYATWATAATDIQSALDVCSPWDTVVVNDGVYTVNQQLLIATDNVTVQSVNGPRDTAIAGDGSVRCLRISGSDVHVEGFTVRDGYIASSSSADYRGANIYCSDDSVTVQNCIITNGEIRVTSHARAYGAGAFNGTYINCDFVDNHALYYGSSWGATLTRGGAAYSCILEDCYVAGNTSKRASGAIGNPSTLAGGGLYACEATGCILENNVARQSGGGAQSSTLRNCLIIGNQAERTTGAGTHASTLESCTVADNIGQGINGGAATNCIIFGNTVTNWAGAVSVGYSCTTPDPGGAGNILSFEGFDFGYYPKEGSVALDSALEMSWMTDAADLSGVQRVIGSAPDMGCYEYFTSRILNISSIDVNNATLEFELIDGVNCMLQTADDPAGVWSDLTNPGLLSGNGTMTVPVPINSDVSGYFRLKYVSSLTDGVGVLEP